MQTNGTYTQESDGESDDSPSTSSSASSGSEVADAATAIGASSSSALTFYPAYCFKASPTWFTWVKLTAHNIHNDLEERSGFHHASVTGSHVTQLTFFLNHPIQFVQLVGVVVNLEDYYERYWLFTIDDSSGATIDVTCRKPVASDPSHTTTVPEKKGAEDTTTNSNDQPEEQQQQQQQKMDPDEKDRVEAMRKLDNGVVVQVKGQITTYRQTRQLDLERITILADTNQEIRLISARTTFFQNVLSRPWVLTDETKQRLWKHAADEKEASQARLLRHRQKEQEKKEREERHAKRIQKRYEREEATRAAAAEEARAAGQRLRSRALQSA